MRITVAIIVMLSLLCGCAEKSTVSETPMIMNSNIPVYKTDTGIYFMQRGIEEDAHSLLMYEDDKGDQEIIQEMPDRSGIIKSIYLSGNDLYYEYIDGQEQARIFEYNIDTCENSELFSVGSDHMAETYVYAVNTEYR